MPGVCPHCHRLLTRVQVGHGERWQCVSQDCTVKRWPTMKRKERP